MMSPWQFEMALRSLSVLDMEELVSAGVIDDRDYAAWDAFCADRVQWYLSHPDRADALFRAIWRHRSPSNEVEAAPPPDNLVDLTMHDAKRRLNRRR